MAPNIDHLVHTLCQEKGLPALCRDVILNTCYFKGPKEYTREFEPVFGKVQERFDDMIRNFFLNSFHGILQNFKYLLRFILILQQEVRQQDVGELKLPWNDKTEMNELLAVYREKMQIAEVEAVWNGKNVDETVTAIYNDVCQKLYDLQDTAFTSHNPEALREYKADPHSCVNYFDDFWEMLVLMIRVFVKAPDYAKRLPFGEKQDEIIRDCLTKFYETGILRQTGMTYAIQSLVKHNLRTDDYLKYEDPVFKKIAHLYNFSSENRAYINELLLLTGTHPEVVLGQIPKANHREQTTDSLFFTFKHDLNNRFKEVNLFAKESHDVYIQKEVGDFVLKKLEEETAPETRQKGFIRPEFKRPASDVSGTSGEQFTQGFKPAPGSFLFVGPEQLQPKKKEGSGNTFLIIALILVAVGIVVFLV